MNNMIIEFFKEEQASILAERDELVKRQKALEKRLVAGEVSVELTRDCNQFAIDAKKLYERTMLLTETSNAYATFLETVSSGLDNSPCEGKA